MSRWISKILVPFTLLVAVQVNGQNYPVNLGYYGGQSVLHENAAVNDTFSVSYGGGGFVPTQWMQHVNNGAATVSQTPLTQNSWMSGFKYNTLYLEKAFQGALFVSKGYYGDYVEVRWDLVRYTNSVSGFKIFRREYLSGDDFEQVANLASDERSWQDEYSESNQLYEYKVTALNISPVEEEDLNYQVGVGFRTPTGRVSGRVTYEGGTAVEEVTVIAETDDDFAGNSLLLDGVDDYLTVTPQNDDEKFEWTSAFAFQAWFRPDRDIATTEKTLLQKGAQYHLTYQKTGTNHVVRLKANTTTLSLTFPARRDTFFHVAAVRETDSLKLYALYDTDTTFVSAMAYAGTTPKNTKPILIGKDSVGNFFKGHVDEMRLWNGEITQENVELDGPRYIDGTEANLVGYYRLNENMGDAFYDLSRKGFSFSENHGDRGTAAWSDTIPLTRQLAVKGITDANGNYTIAGIPYETDGSIYRFVPIYGIHEFDPAEQSFYVGPGSNVYSNINFVDVAAFPVVGYIYYRSTDFPVKGVNVEIDGDVLVGSGGLVTTNALGRFEFDVPIGQHTVEFVKTGHQFSNGTFSRDFQEPYTLQYDIIDTTLVKVVGKVVGGPVEASKPIGLGKTVNNLGPSKIVLSNANYNYASVSSTITHQHPYYTDSLVVVPDDGGSPKGPLSTKVVIPTDRKTVEIYPDTTTGEYVAYLLPELYTIASAKSGYDGAVYQYDLGEFPDLDLKNEYNWYTEIDSVVHPTTPFIITNGDTISYYEIDSVRYNKNLDFIYRVKPSVHVGKANGDTAFWDLTIALGSGTEQLINAGTGKLNTKFPIFTQRGSYKTKITVFESYENQNNGSIQNVPVTDGKVEIINNLSNNPLTQLYEIDSTGKVLYNFTGGKPSMNGEYDQSMTVVAITGNGGNIRTAWEPTIRWFGGTRTESFKGTVLGSIPKGNNFISKGPDQVDMIIRDPYGSESFAFYEAGNSVTTSSTTEYSNELTVNRDLTISGGTKVVTYAGSPVAGVISEAETIADVGVGIEVNTNWSGDKTTSETITNTKTWSTSADPAFVGSNGDVYIGRSLNIVYGSADRLEFKTGTSDVLDVIPGYDITPYETMRFSPEFATAFQYSQNHIEGYLIPNLEGLRDSIVLGCCDALKPFYTFSITDPSDANYGKKNTTTTTSYYDVGGVNITANRPTDPDAAGYDAAVSAFMGTVNEVFMDGNQYDVRLSFDANAANYWGDDKSKQFTDRYAEYATSIAGWKAVLMRNEKEKVEAELDENLSFDAGTVYSSSRTIENSTETTESFTFSIAPEIATKFGGEVMGVGMETEYTRTFKHEETDSEGNTTTSSVTFGFELSDGDEGDYYSMDVKTPKVNTGTVFAVKGGQSMCPYVDEELTKYHQVGTQLSAATEKREVPTLTCDDPIQLDVPGDDPAIFQIELANNSQSSDDQWYMLRVDESTNQDGASVKLDGNPIGNGRVIFVPHTGFGGDGITKTVTIEQVNQAVTDYDNIKLILHSICQYDPGDDWEDIHDFVQISAHFSPVCTSVEIDDPDDLWTRNISSGTTMDVVLKDYDRNRVDFDKVLFQYKPTSSSTWSTAMQFFNTQHSTTSYDDAVTAGQVAQTISAGTINYTFDMEDQPDRQYNIRAKSICSTGPENASATLTGIKDMKPPKVFGTPQPGDGILSPGEDVMIRFDEDIEAGLLISRNFSVRGVLNGSPLRHSAALYFDGTDDYATASQGIDFSNSSFSIEMWVKRDALAEASVLYQQGGVEIGYTNTDEIYVKLANGTATTTKRYNFTDKWIHYTVSYDAELEKLFMYVAYDGYDGIDLSDVDMAPNFNAASRVYVGSNAANDAPFQGYIHDFRVWEKFIGQGTSAANMSVTMNGDEIGMGAFWPMTELKGELATDLSRSHHLLLYGPDWRVFPAGQAYNFDGATHLDFPTGSSVVISNSMDFTVEMYFRADSTQKDVVLFSNGKTDGSDDFAKEDIWEIGINSDGNVYALNNGTYIKETVGGYNDDSWHHVALVMRRKSNTTLYLDGESKGFKHSSFFGGLKGANMTLGASRDYGVGADPYTKGLTGKMDELRIWNLARTKELLNMDLTSKLAGDEMGLVAYYPLDAYDINLLLVSTLNDQDFNDVKDTMSTLSMTATGGSFEGSDVPNIQTPRPVQTLNYDWLVNGDEMILRILEQPSLVEKRVIEFTVRNVEDKNRNEMASPETWTAYIKQNTVVWDETELEFEIGQYAGLAFDVDILNIGGVEQDYTISNLPQWLSVSAQNGTLTPDSRKTLNFTVSEGTNIGTHEEVLYLTSDFGYNERLRVKVKVTGEQPEWPLDPSEFQYSMNVIASVAVDNTLSTDIDDRIVAVVNGEIRGIAEVQYYAQYDSYLAFVDVYSNTAGGEEVEFYVWDASEGKVHTKVNPGLTFADNTLHGTPNTPKAFNATNIFYEPIAVNNGWNWLSFPLKSDDQGNVNDLLSDLSAEDGDIFRSLSQYDQYTSVSNIGWVGGITAAGGIDNGTGYKLKISGKDTIHYVGAKINPDTIKVPMNIGWNWIGFVAQKNLAIADAFTNFTVKHDDLLKGQLSFAIYDSTLGWVGNLTHLKPLNGYMYKSAKLDTLIYPDANLFVYKTQPEESVSTLNDQYGLDPHAYQYNMNAIVAVDFCQGMNEGQTVIAKTGDQVVGIGELNQQKGFMTIYGNGGVDEVTFQIIDTEDRVFEVDNTLTFAPDQLIGSVGDPYVFGSLASLDDCAAESEQQVTGAPGHNGMYAGKVYVENSMLSDQLAVHYNFDEPTSLKIELYDAAGRWISTLADQHQVQGKSKVKWGDTVSGLDLSAGIYFLNITYNGKTVIEKVVNPIK